MAFPLLTSYYAAVLALMFAALSAWVVIGRGQFHVFHGDGGQQLLNRRIRAHGNFTEYVPFIVLLVALFEARGASHLAVHALLGPLVVARVMHPVGMVARQGSLQQYAFRGTSATATWLILIASAVSLLLPN